MKVKRYKGKIAQFYVSEYRDMLVLTKWLSDNDVGWKMLNPIHKCPYDEYGVKITTKRNLFELRWVGLS